MLTAATIGRGSGWTQKHTGYGGRNQHARVEHSGLDHGDYHRELEEMPLFELSFFGQYLFLLTTAEDFYEVKS